jgi:pyruvate dehydrogenase E2 component (dihydrolipoamide acetyltransferase)
VSAREVLNAAGPEQPVSLLALLARFTVLALRRYPELNAHIDGDEIVIPGYVHLGFAAQTERGLVVPVVRDAHQLSTRDLSAALAGRTAAARAGQLSPSDLTGGTITVNNYGVFGVDGSAAIINHPEVAIVGMGRIIDRPWVVDGQLTVRKVSQLTLAFDHRVCDGGTAGGFLRMIADCVERPIVALGDL